jgi:hypothetical protein
MLSTHLRVFWCAMSGFTLPFRFALPCSFMHTWCGRWRCYPAFHVATGVTSPSSLHNHTIKSHMLTTMPKAAAARTSAHISWKRRACSTAQHARLTRASHILGVRVGHSRRGLNKSAAREQTAIPAIPASPQMTMPPTPHRPQLESRVLPVLRSSATIRRTSFTCAFQSLTFSCIAALHARRRGPFSTVSRSIHCRTARQRDDVRNLASAWLP